MTSASSEWQVARPAPLLAPYVDSYIGYRLSGFPPGVHWGLPSRHLTFIVSIGDPIDVVAHPDPAQPRTGYDCVVGGLQSRSARIAHDGSQEGVVVDLTPLGARHLFGMPARELWNAAVELDAVVGAPARELWERLQEPVAWTERFAACDEVLGRLARDVVLHPGLQRAWQLLDASHGQIAIDALAEQIGWSRQHLARRFADEFGASPKRVARIMRFDRAHAMLRDPAPDTIAAVAAACGYYDQAHLDRDFREFAGAPPSQVLTDDLPSFQAADGADRAP